MVGEGREGGREGGGAEWGGGFSGGCVVQRLWKLSPVTPRTGPTGRLAVRSPP